MANKSTLSYIGGIGGRNKFRRKYFYSTPETKGDEFYDKMDSLSEEVKELTKQIASKQEEMVNLVKESLSKDSPPQDEIKCMIYDGGEWELNGRNMEMQDNEEWCDFGYAQHNFYSDCTDIADEKSWHVTYEWENEVEWSVEIDKGKGFQPSKLEWETDLANKLNAMKYDGTKMVEKDLGYGEKELMRLEFSFNEVNVETSFNWDI